MSYKPPTDIADLKRRKFITRLMLLTGGTAVAGASWPFIDSMEPSARALGEGGPVDFNVSTLEPGELATLEWRKRPIWVLRRTPQQLQRLIKMASLLADPDSSTSQQPPDMDLHLKGGLRSVEPEFLVLVGICTHLGCTPQYRPGVGSVAEYWQGGFFCPCHGSRYDLSGRVLNGSPAPLNLPVPPYYFKTPRIITIGETKGGGDQFWQPSIW